MKKAFLRRRFWPVRAARALVSLGRGDEREKSAVRFLQATEGTFLDRRFGRFRSSETGARLLRARASIFDAVRTELERLPPDGSALGDVFRRFQQENGFTIESILEMMEAYDQTDMTAEEIWFVLRMHGAHDFQHVLTGYGSDPLGEICLWHFRRQQTPHTGAAILCAMTRPMLRRLHPGADIAAALREARARGRAAAALDEIEWEALLHEDLDALRARFGLAPPLAYDAIMARRPQHAPAGDLRVAEA